MAWVLWEIAKGIAAMFAALLALVVVGVLWITELLVDLVQQHRKPLGS